MSHVIVPEVIIDPNPLLLELCSDTFDLESLELDLETIESAASMIKEACHASASAINTSKTNLLLAYMAEPKCRRWLKSDFLDRVDCDNGLLTRAARIGKFRFYTPEKLVIEDLDNNGETSPNESVAVRTGVPEKTVVRIKKKLEKKKIEAEEKRAQALQEALEADKQDDLPEVTMTVLDVAMPSERSKELTQNSSSGEEGQVISHESSDSSLEPVNTIEDQSSTEPKNDVLVNEEPLSSETLSPRELALKKEIEQLQLMLAERDAEIANLKALV
ncbi:hypothetical protein PQO01_15425 [Lentisphaera marina]|uniref:hypothetical protein n=1 Tax=Lentisphaera marina TaxID=1111041 RepID=UPI00236585DC|nr:hypothetical protein [Lentisphaera marina]MDD7986339.1 hypothetical protein [Lentisphaera marina]